MEKGTLNLRSRQLELAAGTRWRKTHVVTGTGQSRKVQEFGLVAWCLHWCPLMPNKQCLCPHRHWAEPSTRQSGVSWPYGKDTRIRVREARDHISDSFVTCCVTLGKLFNISDPVMWRPIEGVFIILSFSCLFLPGPKPVGSECVHSLGLHDWTVQRS